MFDLHLKLINGDNYHLVEKYVDLLINEDGEVIGPIWKENLSQKEYIEFLTILPQLRK